MPNQRPSEDDEASIADRVAAIEERLLVQQGELRTNRLVVCDNDGAERIIAEVVDGHAQLRVELANSPSPGGHSHAVLFALAGADDAPAGIGVQLRGDGDALLELNAWRGYSGWSTDVALGPNDPPPTT